MQIILLERIGRLGQMGDVVNVKNGYARNFLLPQKKALRATPENLARFEKDRSQLEARDLELKKEAEAVLATIGLTVSDAFRLLMMRVVADKALPFEPLVPNKKTIEAIKAARRGELTTIYRKPDRNTP